MARALGFLQAPMLLPVLYIAALAGSFPGIGSFAAAFRWSACLDIWSYEQGNLWGAAARFAGPSTQLPSTHSSRRTLRWGGNAVVRLLDDQAIHEPEERGYLKTDHCAGAYSLGRRLA